MNDLRALNYALDLTYQALDRRRTEKIILNEEASEEAAIEADRQHDERKLGDRR